MIVALVRAQWTWLVPGHAPTGFLGQVKVDEKSNEISANRELLKVLEISGCIITIDALGCQTEIAKTVVEEDGDYVLALKDKQGHLFEDTQKLFEDLECSRYQAYNYDYVKTVNKRHDRIEIRECRTISAPSILCHLRGFANWEKLLTVSRIRSQRWIGDKKHLKAAFILPVSLAQNGYWMQYVLNGVLRIACIGFSTLLLMKIVAVYAKTKVRKTSRFFAPSLSTCSNKRKLVSAASRANACWLVGKEMTC